MLRWIWWPLRRTETGIPYQMTYLARDVWVRPDTGLSVHGTKLQLYIRQPGGWFCYINQLQHINSQKIAINIVHHDSCQVVCFFIGPGRCVLSQHLNIQSDNSFATCQVVWNFRNAASEHINIVKRWKPMWQSKWDGSYTQGFPHNLIHCPLRDISLHKNEHWITKFDNIFCIFVFGWNYLQIWHHTN